MHIHNDKIYIIGGYTYKNNVPTKLYTINQLIEINLISNSTVPIVKVIDLMVPVDMTLQKIYGFAGASTNRNIYLFGGFNVDEYSDDAEDFYRFHTHLM